MLVKFRIDIGEKQEMSDDYKEKVSKILQLAVEMSPFVTNDGRKIVEVHYNPRLSKLQVVIFLNNDTEPYYDITIFGGKPRSINRLNKLIRLLEKLKGAGAGNDC